MSHHFESEAIEKTIIQAFGYSIIEFEQVLFHKFLISSGPASVMTDEMFHKHLVSLQSKGFVAPLDFQGKRAWKKLVINWDAELEDLEVSIEPQQMTSEQEEKKQPAEGLISESRTLAKEIKETLKGKITPEWNEDIQKSTIRHAEEMRRALSDSRRDFIRYLESNIPALKQPMKEILDNKGEEVLLLSLRLIAAR
jgi:hypothetical protein